MKKLLLISLGMCLYLSSFSQSSSQSTLTFNQYTGLSTYDKQLLRDTYHQLNEKNFHRFDLISGDEKSSLSNSSLNNLARQRAKIVKAYLVSEQHVKEENVFMKFSGAYPSLWLHKPEGHLTASGSVLLDESKKQCYVYNASTSSSIYTASGSTIYFGPFAFAKPSGEIATGNNINICFWEFMDKKDLVQSNLTTSSNYKMLETGGSFYIEAYQNGEKLELAPGQHYAITIPANEMHNDMFTYYGVQQDGFVDWAVNKTERVGTSGQPMNNEPIEQAQVEIYDEYGDNINNLVNETVFDAPFAYDGETESEEGVNLYELSAGKLGWINCDRFYEAQNTATLAVRLDTDKSMVVRLVFRDINSVMPAYSNSNYNDRYEVSGIPVGEKVLVLAYAVNDSEAFLGYKEITIGENLIEDIDISSMTKSRFNGALSDLIY